MSNRWSYRYLFDRQQNLIIKPTSNNIAGTMVEFIGLTPYTVCFLKNRDSVLLIKFPPDKNVWPGLYNGLGGPIESHESPRESAIKKINKESGVKVKNIELKMVLNVTDYFGRNRLLFFFISNTLNKKINSARDLKWVKLTKIVEEDVAPDLQFLLPKIIGSKEGDIVYGKSSYGKYNELVELSFENGGSIKLPNGTSRKKENLTSIVVSGEIGSGTSSVARRLSRELGWKYISTGEFFRRYQKIHNIPLWDKLLVPIEIEKAVDSEIQEMLQVEKHMVIDAHYGGWLAKDLSNVYKTLLTTEESLALRRVLSRDHTHSETKVDVLKRRKGIVDKFKVLYGHDRILNRDYFDLEVDTSNIGVEEVTKIVLQNFRLHQSKRNRRK